MKDHSIHLAMEKESMDIAIVEGFASPTYDSHQVSDERVNIQINQDCLLTLAVAMK